MTQNYVKEQILIVDKKQCQIGAFMGYMWHLVDVFR